MKIQVIGSGCATCKNLYGLVSKIVAEDKIHATVEYITGGEGTLKLLQLGVLSSPILVVDDRVVMQGFVNDEDKIRTKIMVK